MICIECTHPVSSLYTQYSKTNIRSTACPNCNKFADKYIEQDNVMVAIDLSLLRPQAFRHLVFNVLSDTDQYDSLHSQTKRAWILLTLFDVYLTWARAEKSNLSDSSYQVILQLPIIFQYLTFLLYCIIDSAVLHITIRYLAQKWLKWTRPNALSTAILISTPSKLFPILMLVWSYDIPIAAKLVGWAVNFTMIEVLTIILKCSYAQSIVISSIALLAKTVAEDSLLNFVCIYASWYGIS